MKIFVLVEHRQGKVRDITYELLTVGRELAEKFNGEVTALLFGGVDEKIDRLKKNAHHIILVEDEKLKNFNAELYQKALVPILKDEKSYIMLIGHTAFGIDLAPALATELDVPISTDCVGIQIEDDNFITIRQMYGGKLNAKVSFCEPGRYIITARQAAFPAKDGNLDGKVISMPSPVGEIDYRKFIEYVEPPIEGVDITKADIIVAVGRGIKDKDNIPMVEELANALGGVLACSRPIVDAGWLPKERQVGSSGKTVKPKLYIAIGISGAFQHLVGMKGAETVIAINKDPNAPIFNEADYGIVDDLFKVVPVLKEKIQELKKG